MGNYCPRGTLYEPGTKGGLSSDITWSVKLWRHAGPAGGKAGDVDEQDAVADLVISATQMHLHYGAQSQSLQNLFEIISL